MPRPIDLARDARDEGMERAHSHAESKKPGWSDMAYEFLKRYAETHDRFPGWFVTREVGLTRAVPAPPTPKAWGSVFRMAMKRGLIEHTNTFTQDPYRHANPCPVWRSLVFKVP